MDSAHPSIDLTIDSSAPLTLSSATTNSQNMPVLTLERKSTTSSMPEKIELTIDTSALESNVAPVIGVADASAGGVSSSLHTMQESVSTATKKVATLVGTLDSGTSEPAPTSQVASRLSRGKIPESLLSMRSSAQRRNPEGLGEMDSSNVSPRVRSKSKKTFSVKKVSKFLKNTMRNSTNSKDSAPFAYGDIMPKDPQEVTWVRTKVLVQPSREEQEERKEEQQKTRRSASNRRHRLLNNRRSTSKGPKTSTSTSPVRRTVTDASGQGPSVRRTLTEGSAPRTASKGPEIADKQRLSASTKKRTKTPEKPEKQRTEKPEKHRTEKTRINGAIGLVTKTFRSMSPSRKAKKKVKASRGRPTSRTASNRSLSRSRSGRSMSHSNQSLGPSGRSMSRSGRTLSRSPSRSGRSLSRSNQSLGPSGRSLGGSPTVRRRGRSTSPSRPPVTGRHSRSISRTRGTSHNPLPRQRPSQGQPKKPGLRRNLSFNDSFAKPEDACVAMLQKEADELRETIRKPEQEKSEKAKVLETTQSGANSSSEESKCKCGFIYKEGNRFCGGCGRKLAWCCKKCKHEENSVSYKFCVECGAAKCSSSRDSRSKKAKKKSKKERSGTAAQ